MSKHPTMCRTVQQKIIQPKVSIALLLKNSALQRNTFPLELQAPVYSLRFSINVTFLERPSLITLFKFDLSNPITSLYSVTQLLCIIYESFYLPVCFLFVQLDCKSDACRDHVSCSPQYEQHFSKEYMTLSRKCLLNEQNCYEIIKTTKICIFN